MTNQISIINNKMKRLLNMFHFIALLSCMAIAQHPFVGENAEASSIENEDGSIAIRLNPTEMHSTKYDLIIKVGDISTPRQSIANQLAEAVFGKSLARKEFEAEIDHFVKQKRRKEKRLGDPHIATLLSTLDNLIWTGTLYMGPSFKTVSIIFDTSSDWLAVEDSSCGSCSGNKFDASRTGKLVNTSKVLREYGSIAFSAYEYEDKVCLVTTTCVNKLQYLAI